MENLFSSAQTGWINGYLSLQQWDEAMVLPAEEGAAELYLVTDESLAPYEARSMVVDFPGGTFQRLISDSQAIRQCLLAAIGASTEYLGERDALVRFSDAFSRNVDLDLPGPVWHLLRDIAEDSANTLFHETDIADGAATPESLSLELANKIREDLTSATVTLAGEGEAFSTFAKYWRKQTCRHFYVIHQDFQMAESLATGENSLPVRWEDRWQYLSESDVILVAGERYDLDFTSEMLRQNLQRRRHQHLLIFHWNNTPVPEHAGSRFSEVFLYSRDELEEALKQTRERRRKVLSRQDDFLQQQVSRFYRRLYSGQHYRFHDLIGQSRRMQHVFDLITRVAPTDITVLIEGETGTGKELVARAIHRESQRNSGPFIPVNCGAIPETLLESELFGHIKGAFTGADTDRRGLLKEASGGTVFLDEIGDTSEMFQVKLLRALQEKEVTPLGSNKPQSFNARIIAATRQNLQESVEHGAFRSDLYYRINVVKIGLPPLKERPDDISALIAHFITRFNERMGKKIQGVTAEAERALLEYPWPGNVRELENIIERAIALGLGDEITRRDLPEHLTNPPAAPGADRSGIKTLEEVEKEYITKLLETHQGNYAEVAELLGIGRTTLWRKMKKYGLEDRD